MLQRHSSITEKPERIKSFHNKPERARWGGRFYALRASAVFHKEDSWMLLLLRGVGKVEQTLRFFFPFARYAKRALLFQANMSKSSVYIFVFTS